MKTALIVLFCFASMFSFAQAPAIRKVSAKDVRAIMDSCSGPTIINFWASFCGPCVKEIPYFEQQVQQSPRPVKLVLVSLDIPRLYPARFKEFLMKTAFKSEMVLLKDTENDYAAVDKDWGGAIPASIFFDNSKKYYRLFNTQLTAPRLELELKNMLNYEALPVSSR